MKHLITPPARFNGRMGARPHAGAAGRFSYELPAGVVWADSTAPEPENRR